MSKAIAGAAMIAADVAMYAGLVLMPVASIALVVAYNALAVPLLAGGLTMETAAIADALTSNRGMNISTRQAAGLRQIVYGKQRIGGVTCYQSTTGVGGSGGQYVYNYIIALASHEIDGIENLYLDGRRVFWKQNGNTGNVGCGSVTNPPAATATISSGAITAISATGGSGFNNVKPTRYRVRINGGGGTGASAYATNSGTPTSPVWHVTMVTGGNGYTSQPTIDIQGLFNFGGTGAADEQDPSQPGYGIGYGIGPGGPHYNFSGKVYCEARFGDQVPGDYMQSLSYNDPAWPSTARGAGVAYIYLNIGYAPDQFPGAPEVRLTINGKNNVFDPRTGKTGYSTNWALQVADVITDPVFGLGDNTVNQAQLIAAANVCSEQVMTSQGNEDNYQQHLHYDTSTAPGDALAMMMPTAAGRLSRIGGQWFIWPAYWQGPSFTMDSSSLIGDIEWDPYRSAKDLVNCVNGTYVAPNYPYACTGNLYDNNGFYYGATNNLWPFAWQPTNFPQYAVDTLHGFGSNIYLAQDGGIVLPKEITLRGVVSVVQAQRVAKINLMRNRMQGSGVFPMSLATWKTQPLDVMQFNFSQMGWTNKYLEIDKIQLKAEPLQTEDGEDGAMALSCSVSVQETDPSVYEWTLSEELTPSDAVASPYSSAGTVQPPAGLTLTDNSTTAVMQNDGTTLPRMLVSWTPPDDVYVNTGGSIQVQWQDYSGLYRLGGWVDVGTYSGNSTCCFIDGVSSVTSVNVQVRAIRSNGAASAWVGVNNHTFPRPRPILPIGPGPAPMFQFVGSGKTLDTLEPAEAGANITETRVALNTQNVGVRASSDVVSTVVSGGGIDFSSSLHKNKTLDNVSDGASRYGAIQAASFGEGCQLWPNCEFAGGSLSSFATYHGTGTTIAAVQDSTTPNTTGYRMHVAATSTDSNNWFGFSGIMVVNTSGGGYSPCNIPAGHTALIRVVANVPANFTLNLTEDGDMTITPMSSMVGTGAWATYIWQVVIPATDAHGQWGWNFGFIYAQASGSVSNPSLDVASYSVVDISMPAGVSVSATDSNRKALIDFTQSGHVGKLAVNIPYASGASLESLKPAQAGADITGSNTAHDVTYVNGSPSSSVAQGSTGLNRNLIPDSDFKFKNTYWGVTSGTWNFSPGAGYNGTNLVSVPVSGSGVRWQMNSANIPMVPGQVYTLSGWVDGRYVASGSPIIWIVSGSYFQIGALAGANGRYSVTFTCPVGCTSAYIMLDTMAATVAGGSPPYLCAFSAPMLQTGAVMTAYQSNILDESTGYLKAGSTQIDLSSSMHLNKTLAYITDGGGRYGAAESGANVTNAHVLSSSVVGSGSVAVTGMLQPISGLAWSAVTASSSDVYNILATILEITTSMSVPLVLAIVIDGVIASPKASMSFNCGAATTYNTLTYFATITGLSAGSHTIAIYVSGSTAISVSGAASSALCQRIF